MGVLKALVLFLWGWFVTRAHLIVENLALRQQLAVMKRSHKRPRLRPLDRAFWTWLMRLWPRWKSVLIIVQPETVIRWHRQGFRLYWRWKSQARSPGRPAIGPEIRALIRRISKENPTWGVPRIQSELALLGHDLAKSTVAKYLFRSTNPPPKLGAHFWTIILATWSASTSLPYP